MRGNCKKSKSSAARGMLGKCTSLFRVDAKSRSPPCSYDESFLESRIGTPHAGAHTCIPGYLYFIWLMSQTGSKLEGLFRGATSTDTTGRPRPHRLTLPSRSRFRLHAPVLLSPQRAREIDIISEFLQAGEYRSRQVERWL